MDVNNTNKFSIIAEYLTPIEFVLLRLLSFSACCCFLPVSCMCQARLFADWSILKFLFWLFCVFDGKFWLSIPLCLSKLSTTFLQNVFLVFQQNILFLFEKKFKINFSFLFLLYKCFFTKCIFRFLAKFCVILFDS